MGWPETAAPEEKAIPVEIPQAVAVDPEKRSWKRKATKAFMRGESADVEFETNRIPLPVQTRIHDRLAQVKEKSEILRAFTDD